VVSCKNLKQKHHLTLILKKILAKTVLKDYSFYQNNYLHLFLRLKKSEAILQNINFAKYENQSVVKQVNQNAVDFDE
jgi:hypothetical protein